MRRFRAKDATSPIADAEYKRGCGCRGSIWSRVGRVLDSLEERYDFTSGNSGYKCYYPGLHDAREHVLAVRVYDRYDNVVNVKTVSPPLFFFFSVAVGRFFSQDSMSFQRGETFSNRRGFTEHLVLRTRLRWDWNSDLISARNATISLRKACLFDAKGIQLNTECS